MLMQLRMVELRNVDVMRRPEGWRMKTKASPIWWRRKLADWCWGALHRLNAVEPFFYFEKSYSYGDAEQGKVTELLSSAICSLIGRNEDINAYCFVIGGKEFSELMHSEPFRCDFSVPAATFYSNRNGYRSVFDGIPIHVVSGLSGVAAIPRVIVEKKVNT